MKNFFKKILFITKYLRGAYISPIQQAIYALWECDMNILLRYIGNK